MILCVCVSEKLENGEVTLSILIYVIWLDLWNRNILGSITCLKYFKQCFYAHFRFISYKSKQFKSEQTN